MACSEKGIDESMLIGKLSDAGLDGVVLVHADEHLLVFDKPSGQLSVPGRGSDKQDCLAARAQRLYPDALVVHRLDMATSGLFLMARGASMQRRLSDAFAQREVGKRYVAVVSGRLEAPVPSDAGGWGLIDLPLDGKKPRGIALVAHPHPLYGGTMENKVTQTLARAFVALDDAGKLPSYLSVDV